MTDSGQQPEFLAELYRLRPPLGPELVEGAAAMRLDRVLTHEQLSGNLTVAHPLRYQFENLQLAARDAKVIALFHVRNEWLRHEDRNFLHYDPLPRSEPKAEPDAKYSKRRCDQSTIDFHGVFEDEELVVGPLQHSNQDPAYKPEDEHMPLHMFRKTGLRQYDRSDCCRSYYLRTLKG